MGEWFEQTVFKAVGSMTFHTSCNIDKLVYLLRSHTNIYLLRSHTNIYLLRFHTNIHDVCKRTFHSRCNILVVVIYFMVGFFQKSIDILCSILFNLKII